MSRPVPLRAKLLWVACGASVIAALWLLDAYLGARGTMPPSPAVHPAVRPTAVGAQPAADSRGCFLGVVLAREVVEVAAEIEGRLESVTVRLGDVLEAGQSIAVVDVESRRHQRSIEQAQLTRARAGERQAVLEKGRTENEYQRRLALTALLSKAEIEDARFAAESAAVAVESAAAEITGVQARIAQLDATLAHRVVRAPFAGIVARRYLDPGAVVMPGSAVVRLLSSRRLLRFAVEPADAATIPIGARLRVEVEAQYAILEATVERLAPEIDSGTQMVFIEAALSGPRGAIPLGAIARVTPLGSDQAAPLPCLDASDPDSQHLGRGRIQPKMTHDDGGPQRPPTACPSP